MTDKNPREEYSRLNVRLKSHTKDDIAMAADILGQSLTEFAETTLSERASEVIGKYERFVLTEEETKFFLEMLDAPPATPSEKSLKALRKYKEMVKTGELIVRT